VFSEFRAGYRGVGFRDRGVAIPDITRDEADRCPYCGALLLYPPNCCDQARADREMTLRQELKDLEIVEDPDGP
jgi:hypothetical protein